MILVIGMIGVILRDHLGSVRSMVNAQSRQFSKIGIIWAPAEDGNRASFPNLHSRLLRSTGEDSSASSLQALFALLRGLVDRTVHLQSFLTRLTRGGVCEHCSLIIKAIIQITKITAQTFAPSPPHKPVNTPAPYASPKTSSALSPCKPVC